MSVCFFSESVSMFPYRVYDVSEILVTWLNTKSINKLCLYVNMITIEITEEFQKRYEEESGLNC
jgi:hypothetical protein